MTHFQIVAIYAALCTLVLIGLSMNCARVRSKTQVLLGDGGNEFMRRAMRAHSNAVEYIPITLIAMVILASLQASIILLHVIGVLITVGRTLHAFGLTRNSGMSFGRLAGQALTVFAGLASLGGLVYYALFA